MCVLGGLIILLGILRGCKINLEIYLVKNFCFFFCPDDPV